MREFKFFQKGTLDDPQMLDGETYITASFNDDTPEGHMSRRALYQTNPDLYGRLRHPNNEMERYFYERNLRHDNLTTERRAEIIRRINVKMRRMNLKINIIHPKMHLLVRWQPSHLDLPTNDLAT